MVKRFVKKNKKVKGETRPVSTACPGSGSDDCPDTLRIDSPERVDDDPKKREYYEGGYSQWREHCEDQWQSWNWPPHGWAPSTWQNAYWDTKDPYHKYKEFDWSAQKKDDSTRSTSPPSVAKTLLSRSSSSSLTQSSSQISLVAEQLRRSSTGDQLSLQERLELVALEEKEDTPPLAQQLVSQAKTLLRQAKAMQSPSAATPDDVMTRAVENEDPKDEQKQPDSMKSTQHVAYLQAIEQSENMIQKLKQENFDTKVKYWDAKNKKDMADMNVADAMRQSNLAIHEANQEAGGPCASTCDRISKLGSEVVDKIALAGRYKQECKMHSTHKKVLEKLFDMEQRKLQRLKSGEVETDDDEQNYKELQQLKKDAEKAKVHYEDVSMMKAEGETRKAEQNMKESEMYEEERRRAQEFNEEMMDLMQQQADEYRARRIQELADKLLAEEMMKDQAEQAAEDAKKAEEMKKAEEAKKAAEDAKMAEEMKKADEATQAEEMKKAEEAKQAAEDAKKADEAKQAAEDAKKAEEMKKAEEAKQAAEKMIEAEEMKKTDEAKQAAEDAKKAEEMKKAEEATQAGVDSEKAEEMKKAEEAKQAAEDARRQRR